MNRYVFILMFVFAAELNAAELKPETIAAWTRYVQAAEQRIGNELRSGRGYLSLDFQSQTAAMAERGAVMRGDIPIVKLRASDDTGRGISVPDGMVHHWRGTVFIPGVTLADVLSRVANPSVTDTRQEDVLTSRVIERSPGSLKLYLKLQRSKFVTVVYNTEHLVQYRRDAPTRGFSSSVATRIAELENPNSNQEREKPTGHDRGFLWRLNSYWRYEQVQGGVIVECESASLSRTIPAGLEFVIRPLIDSVARESMRRTLSSMRTRLGGNIALSTCFEILRDASSLRDFAVLF